jgi:N-acetylglucosaminyldiphosphoundecaprenol N-acetyl-beta-D-mannosaminyltransferase
MKEIKARGKKKDGYIVNIMGVDVVSTSTSSVLTMLEDKMGVKGFAKPYFVVTANPEIIMLVQDDSDYMKILNSADLVIADGIGLKLAGIKNVLPGRVLVEKLLSKKIKVFFLGGRDGVAQEMAKKYGGEYHQGHDDIKFQDTRYKKQNDEIVLKISKYKPDLVLVAYGAPWQERWIAQNIDKLQAKVVMGVGGTFDYLTGRKPVPPEWVNKAGLEWLWRLVHEPWRWRRQLALVRFVWLIFSRGRI